MPIRYRTYDLIINDDSAVSSEPASAQAFTARPGRIKAEVPVPLPHPRDYRVKTAPEFQALKARLTEEIRIEALRAAGLPASPQPA